MPGRYETMWFSADKLGRYHLFCAEYCGTDHAHMGGMADRHEPARLRRLAASSRAASRRLPRRAQQLFRRYGCSGCHERRRHGARARTSTALFGSPVPLADGSVVVADERYIRDSILMPEGAGRGGLRARHAVVRRADRRGRPRQARRLHRSPSDRSRTERR